MKTDRRGIGNPIGPDRRSGKVPLRRCARAGCEGSSAFTLVFDYAKAEAWLCDLWAEAGPGSYDLCVDHAERFTAPLGWTYLDRRQASPALLVEGSQESGSFQTIEARRPERATA
ncbi:MAG: DUF3499 domain-containing protein [Acidimicrobiia bacterium]